MGLIDLKTNLKTLPYGSDQKGGGSSNQPYIVTPIPDGYTENASDFLLRNGRLNLVSSEQDVSRLTKLFKDTKSPNGLQFIAKQTLLERQNVEIPGGFNRIYNPLSTLTQAGVISTGYHLNKQGFNFFQRGYFNGGDSGYYRTTLRDNELDINRLYGLYKIKQIDSKSNPPETSLLSSTYNISSNPSYLFSYSGGPGSVLGIGNTNIRVIGNGYGNPLERTNTYSPDTDNNNVYVFTNTQLGEEESRGKFKSTTLSSLTDYREIINGNLNKDTIPQTPYSEFNREKTYRTGNTEFKPRQQILNTNYSYINRIDRQQNLIPLFSGDPEIENAKYSDLIKFYFEKISNEPDGYNEFLFFRAYINNISDNFKADWQTYKYVGRAENLYKYSGFSRDFSLSFTIYAHSRAEMDSIYRKLNSLVGLTAPDYSESGYMRGNIIRLTIGDYLNDTPCIVQNISLKPSLEAGWDLNRYDNGKPLVDFSYDISDPNSDFITNILVTADGNDPNPETSEDATPSYNTVGQLPRMIDVDMSIIPIHNFTPEFGREFIRELYPTTIYNE